MKKLLLFALLCVPAFGQVHSDIATQNTVGNWVKVVPGALVYVCDPNTADASCLIGTGVTTLYTTSGLTTPTTQPITADSNGNYTFYATPGIYKQCVKGTTSYCQQIQVAGIGTQNGIPFNCPAAVNGSVVGMTSTITSSCDPNGITDFVGHWTSQSYRATGSFNGTVELTGGLSDPTNAPDTNSVAFLAPTAVPTPYYLRPPASVGTVGQCLDLLTQTASTNGTINALSWVNCGAGTGSVTSFSAGNLSPLFTTSVATATTTPALTFALSNAAANTVLGNLTGSSAAPSYTATQGTDTKVLSSGTVSGTAQSLCTDANGGATTSGCPTGGLPTTQIATPTAPTLSTNGSAGATSRTYAIVGCEDVACVYHTPASSTTTIATTNATLTSGNSVNLSVYGDTLYGPRCFNVYRTASAGTPSTTGLIAACVGKKFVDTGLAGDGTTAPATNTTILTINMSPNPGCNIPPNGIIGVDAPPCSPTATDDEMGPTFQVPADTNDPFWTWYNQGSATAAWSGGTIILTSDTASNVIEALTLPLPGTPFTYEVYVDSLNINSPTTCGLGLTESITNHTSYIGFLQDQNNTASANGGTVLGVTNTTSTSITGVFGGVFQDGFWGGNAAYLKIQDDGTNLKYSFSNTGDGVAFKQMASQAITTPFPTNAPTKLSLISSSSTNGAAICVFDFVRRTQ